MQYHTPDPIWKHFLGTHDYESYLANAVVYGHFHKGVPQEVVEGYTVAEYIMAHAWYHYPMLDEALVKLLRLLEMSIKIRCTQLGICIKNINSHGKEINVNLSNLIKKLTDAEPAKDIKSILDWLRNARNYLMHPRERSLFGSIAFGHIRYCVIILNALFLQERYFLDSKAELERVRKSCNRIDGGQFVLEYRESCYLVYQYQFAEAYLVEGEWQVLCILNIVGYEPTEGSETTPSPISFIFLVRKFKFEENSFSGIISESGEHFILSVDAGAYHASLLAKFNSEVESLEENLWIFKARNHSDINSKITEMRYKYWGALLYYILI